MQICFQLNCYAEKEEAKGRKETFSISQPASARSEEANNNGEDNYEELDGCIGHWEIQLPNLP